MSSLPTSNLWAQKPEPRSHGLTRCLSGVWWDAHLAVPGGLPALSVSPGVTKKMRCPSGGPASNSRREPA